MFYEIVLGFLLGLGAGVAVVSLAAAGRLRRMRREFEEREFKLAEANLRLLELGETLEEQKFKLAEASLTMLEQKEIIEEERRRSEILLLNILPAKVAEELKNKGTHSPELFDEVTVVFADLVDFTAKSGTIEPATLIGELNDIFTGFDGIAVKHGCERIKTIGDTYLLVCGMPDKRPDHAVRAVRAALEFIDFLEERNRSAPHQWRTRVGVHSGPVVAGIVGVSKYIYDVFGDTINTASRMETHSSPMRVNISAATRKLLTEEGFAFQARENEEVKGKGSQKMFFIEFQVPAPRLPNPPLEDTP